VQVEVQAYSYPALLLLGDQLKIPPLLSPKHYHRTLINRQVLAPVHIMVTYHPFDVLRSAIIATKIEP